MVTTDLSWFARHRRNQARMRQVKVLMLEHYLRYPGAQRWVPDHQRLCVPHPSDSQNGVTS